MTSIDWDVVATEVTRHLTNLIRIDTSNPPGNEINAAHYLRDVLSRDGIESTILEMAPNRANLVARLHATNPSAGPLLLFGHLDVVPADPAGWTYEPFAGTVADGHVWGRGAVDMKHIVAAMLTAFLMSKRLDLPLRRDLVFAATADEESAGESGAAWLFRTNRDLVECALAVTEGAPTFTYNGSKYYVIEIGQKGWLTVDLVNRSRPGHSSLPTRDNCLLAVGDVLHHLGARRFPHHVTSSARMFIEALAADQLEPERGLLRSLLVSSDFDEVLKQLSCDEHTRRHIEALLHSHATPTMIHGGESTWAVPEKVNLRLAGRVLPGQTVEEWLAELEGVIGPLGVHTTSTFDAGVEMAPDSRLYTHLVKIIRRYDPQAKILPALSTAGGDSRHPHFAGADSLGFFPLAPEQGTPDILSLAHARDERISVGNLVRCVHYAWDLINATNNLPLT